MLVLVEELLPPRASPDRLVLLLVDGPLGTLISRSTDALTLAFCLLLFLVVGCVVAFVPFSGGSSSTIVPLVVGALAARCFAAGRPFVGFFTGSAFGSGTASGFGSPVLSVLILFDFRTNAKSSSCS
jgi:hypothetical protein